MHSPLQQRRDSEADFEAICCLTDCTTKTRIRTEWRKEGQHLRRSRKGTTKDLSPEDFTDVHEDTVGGIEDHGNVAGQHKFGVGGHHSCLYMIDSQHYKDNQNGSHNNCHHCFQDLVLIHIDSFSFGKGRKNF